MISLILEEKVTDKKIGYEFLSLQVHYGTSQVPTATVSLKNQENEQLMQEAATGAGSVEAVYNTLGRCIDKNIELTDYRIQSNRKGEDALAQVYVRVTVNGKETSGRGIAQDVLEASAKAYLNAVSQAVGAGLQFRRIKETDCGRLVIERRTFDLKNALLCFPVTESDRKWRNQRQMY